VALGKMWSPLRVREKGNSTLIPVTRDCIPFLAAYTRCSGLSWAKDCTRLSRRPGGGFAGSGRAEHDGQWIDFIANYRVRGAEVRFCELKLAKGRQHTLPDVSLHAAYITEKCKCKR